MTISRFAAIAPAGLALLSMMGCKTGPTPQPASTYDIRIDASLTPNPALQTVFLVAVTHPPGSPPAPSGSVLVIQGSLTFNTGTYFTNAPAIPGWTCTGAWANFTCTSPPLAAPLDNEGGYMPTVFTPPPPPNTVVTYSVTVTMIGNTDPNPADNTYGFSHNMI
jgi:hypothetical protein